MSSCVKQHSLLSSEKFKKEQDKLMHTNKKKTAVKTVKQTSKKYIAREEELKNLGKLHAEGCHLYLR